MGDFFASLFLLSWYKECHIFPKRFGPDSFTYEPWSKRWIFRDSTEGKFRDKIISIDPNHDDVVNLMIETIHSNKIKSIPYFFISENLGKFKRLTIPDINVIKVNFSDPDYHFLYVFLRWYKLLLSRYTTKDLQNIDKNFYSKENFLNQTHSTSDPIEFFGVRSYTNIDMLDLIINENVQLLDIINTNDMHIQNMIKTARLDLYSIFDYIGYNLGDKLDSVDLDMVYHKLKKL